MIFQPVVSGGGASGGSDWKEVDRSYVAEHTSDQDANFLVAVFTTDFPNQPMIIPASWIFGIGKATVFTFSACSYNAKSIDEGTSFYVYSTGEMVIISNDQDGSDVILGIDLTTASGEPDDIPEGWTVKYYIYTPS